MTAQSLQERQMGINCLAMAIAAIFFSLGASSTYAKTTEPSSPHLMLMPKDPSTLDGFISDFMTGAPYVMFRDTDYVHLMIPVEDYYRYQQ